jgi:cation diffusion facilitator family transporter
LIRLIANRILKEKSKPSLSNRHVYGLVSSCVGIALNIILFIIKLTAALLSGSASIIADAVNNISDAASSVITLFGFKFAKQGADTEHPYGHGRIEYVAGFLVSLLIIVMGFETGKHALKRIITPAEISLDYITIIILCVSLFIKLYMYLYNKRIGKAINSASMIATAQDSISDVVATSGVLAAILLTRFTSLYADGICAAIVSIFIIYTGFTSARQSVALLIGKAPSKDFIKELESIVLSHKGVSGLHDISYHDYGPERKMVSLHAEMSSEYDINAAHDLIDIIERELLERLGVEAVVHIDPVRCDSYFEEVKESLSAAVRGVNENYSIHDLRVLRTPDGLTLYFDTSVPFEERAADKDINAQLTKAVKQLDPTYHAVITIDRRDV